MSPAKSGPYTPLVTAGIAVIVILTAPYQLAVALWRHIRDKLRGPAGDEQAGGPSQS